MIVIDTTCTKGGFKLSVQFELEGTGITALCGPSGAGKTTLLRAIAGLEPEAAGKISIGGMIWLDTQKNTFLKPEHRSVGFVFQEARLFPHLSVEGNLQFAFNRSNRKSNYAYPDVVEWLGLQGFLNRMPPTLSGGEQRRAAIARALLTYPDILLFDEPLNGLDFETAESISQYIRSAIASAGIPALYVTHNFHELRKFTGEMIYLAEGRIKFHGQLQAAIEDPSLPYAGRNL